MVKKVRYSSRLCTHSHSRGKRYEPNFDTLRTCVDMTRNYQANMKLILSVFALHFGISFFVFLVRFLCLLVIVRRAVRVVGFKLHLAAWLRIPWEDSHQVVANRTVTSWHRSSLQEAYMLVDCGVDFILVFQGMRTMASTNHSEREQRTFRICGLWALEYSSTVHHSLAI